MKSTIFLGCSAFLLLISPVMAQQQQFYCPQNAAYITINMTQAQVLAACGQPLTKQSTDGPVTQRVPVKQLFYTTFNTGSVYPGLNSAFYQQWSLPSGSTGVNLQVNIINNKVSAINLNGSNSNAMSLCGVIFK